MFNPLDIPHPEFNGSAKILYLCIRNNIKNRTVLKEHGYNGIDRDSYYVSIRISKNGKHKDHMFTTGNYPGVGAKGDIHYIVPQEVFDRASQSRTNKMLKALRDE